MLAKARPYPLLPPALVQSRLVQNLAFLLLVNWLCQGTRGMGRRELLGRLVLESVLAIAAAAALALAGASAMLAALFGVVVAHTLQFLLNGQFWVCMRYSPSWSPDPERNLRFLQRTVAGLRARPWLREAVCIGSLGGAAGRASRRSDLDLRLVFPPGVAGFLRAHGLLLRLRTHALFARVPLDLYAWDGPEGLLRHRSDEPVGLLLDRDGRLRQRFGTTRELVDWP